MPASETTGANATVYVHVLVLEIHAYALTGTRSIASSNNQLHNYTPDRKNTMKHYTDKEGEREREREGKGERGRERERERERESKYPSYLLHQS